MREERATLRLNNVERSRIAIFAKGEGLTLSEAIRRLIFWHRSPDFTLPELIQSEAQDMSDTN
jgi:hypothetical protein